MNKTLELEIDLDYEVMQLEYILIIILSQRFYDGKFYHITNHIMQTLEIKDEIKSNVNWNDRLSVTAHIKDVAKNFLNLISCKCDQCDHPC